VCTRLVECRYSQLPRVDFQESYAHVTYVTFQILLFMVLTWILKGKIVGIETEFGIEISGVYMQIPTGMEARETCMSSFKENMYGLVTTLGKFN
jgi:hypothetical protein